MIFWGLARSGARLLLGEPSAAVLSFDRDAPADLLRVTFPADRLWEELSEVTLEEGEETVFRGIVDEQNTALGSGGLTVELICRGLEALLLDNEAPPGVMVSPGLEVLEDRLLLPLGLTLGEGEERGDCSPRRGELAVSKGESCWTVLARFCGRYLGTEPFVDATGRVRCDGQPGRTLELGEVISAQVSLLPCKRLSEVWVQSARGSYDTPFRAAETGTPRRRYVSLQSGKNPKALLEKGERDSFLLTVTAAGALWPGRNASVSVTIPGLERFENCPVKSAQIRLDKDGERTKFVLERGERVCG